MAYVEGTFFFLISWEVDLLGVDLLGVDLLGVDLLGVDLLGVDLVGVGFVRVDLVGLTRIFCISQRVFLSSTHVAVTWPNSPHPFLLS